MGNSLKVECLLAGVIICSFMLTIHCFFHTDEPLNPCTLILHKLFTIAVYDHGFFAQKSFVSVRLEPFNFILCLCFFTEKTHVWIQMSNPRCMQASVEVCRGTAILFYVRFLTIPHLSESVNAL